MAILINNTMGGNLLSLRTARNWRGPGEYIGRPHPRFPTGSPLHNPYRLGIDGDRAVVLAQYRRYLRRDWLAGGPLRVELRRLADLYRVTGQLDLICWCSPLACHGDIVLAAVAELLGDNPPDLTAVTRLLMTGSREADSRMFDYARRAVGRARELGWSIVVGEAEGIDAVVIDACDALGVPVEVHGAYQHLRRQSATGRNLAHPGSYPQRDRLMVERADRCLAIWNGRSRGTRLTFEYARARGVPTDVRTFTTE